jgi:hypothetical protein
MLPLSITYREGPAIDDSGMGGMGVSLGLLVGD